MFGRQGPGPVRGRARINGRTRRDRQARRPSAACLQAQAHQAADGARRVPGTRPGSRAQLSPLRVLLGTAYARHAGETDGTDAGARVEYRADRSARTDTRKRRSEEHKSELQSLMRISYA